MFCCYIICQLLSDYRLTRQVNQQKPLVNGHTVNHWGLSAQGALTITVHIYTLNHWDLSSQGALTNTVHIYTLNHWDLSAQGALTNTVLIQFIIGV